MIKCHLMADILGFLIKNNSHFTLQLPDLFNKSNHIFNYRIQIKIPQILFCLNSFLHTWNKTIKQTIKFYSEHILEKMVTSIQ
jgi:hypothetical protein